MRAAGRCAWLVLPAVAALGAGWAAAGEVRVPPVPKGHPRVYVRPADLPAIRAKLKLPQFAQSWKVVRETAAGPGDASAFCSAFVYLVSGDKAAGRKAVDGALQALRGSRHRTESGRTFRVPFHWAACVYDWCYDLLTAEAKQAFVGEFERIANLHTPRYPARQRCYNAVGHTAEAWVLTGQLPAGVAIYDEQPKMYDAVARLFLSNFVPVRDYHYAAHMHHQGTHYATRFLYDLGAAWLFKRMGAGDVFSGEMRFVAYEHLYHLRGDGQQIRRGDSCPDTRSGRRWSIVTLAAAYWRDPYLLAARDAGHWWNHCHRYSEVFDLLFRPADLTGRPAGELPLTKYFAHPMGEMIARTGWSIRPDSRDALVHMRIGGTFFGNHQCPDMGTFQIHYRGPLAPASGSYQGGYGTDHWRNYYHLTLASNGLLVFDPDEDLAGFRRVNAGGQRIPNGRNYVGDLEMIRTKGYELGRVTGRAFGPDPMKPEYSYIAGDITKAYTDKVRLVTRSMVTLNLASRKYPCMLVVFDRVVSSKTEFKKTWLLHSIQEPTITGDTVTVIRSGRSWDGQGTYAGKLEVRSLLPRPKKIRKIGGPGKEFWIESAQRNYPVRSRREGGEPGAWRVEVSPAQPRKRDHFLHALTVMDADTPAGPVVRRFGGDQAVGVAALDRAVVFALSEDPPAELSFTLPDAAKRKVLICGLAAGHWRVVADGKVIAARAAVARESGSVYFSAAAEQVQLKRVDVTVPPQRGDTFWDGLRKASRGARQP